MSTPADLVNLRRRHAALLHDRPGLRAYDAAEALAASEVELVAAGCTGPVVRLRSDWKGIFEGLPALGTVMALTRNAHAVHEKVGRYEDVQVRAHGGLVLGPDIDLRLFLNRWHSAFAVTGERHRSLQFFDGQGRAVHKIFARPETDMSAWEGLIAGFGETGVPASLILRRGPSAPQKKPASGGREALRDAWAALKDTHDFVVMLSKFGLERTEAFRLVGRDMAQPVRNTALRLGLEKAAESGQPIMVFVPNKATIQIHTGPVTNLKTVGDWFNVMDPGFNLHVKETAIAESWIVRKPTVDGTITSIELFDSDGGVIAYVFGARKPGQAEAAGWRVIADALARDLAA